MTGLALAAAPETVILARVETLKERAALFAGVRRRDDLYAALGACLTLCEDIRLARQEEEVRAAIAAKAKGARSRTYAETETDVHVLLCRYIFEHEGEARHGAWRYGVSLREAAKRQISGADLPAWLASNGGLRALFLARPVEARSLSTKTLHLTSPITAPKEEPFTVTLRYNGQGAFDVETGP